MKNKFLPFLALLVMQSCMDFTDENHYEVNPVLEPYVQSFFKEAEQRGYFFDKNILSVQIKLMEKDAGLSINGIHNIFVDTTSYLWHTNPEALIFHEMGHSFLLRKHKLDRFNDQLKSVKSIMYPGIGNYYSDEKSIHWEYRRKYYVDELFNPSTESPDWIK